MSKRRKIAIGSIVGALIVALTGLAIVQQGERGTEVRTEAVGRRDLTAVVTASGVIQPKRKVDISADISGRVIELAVEEGQWVDRGDLLLRIDPTAYEANVRRAEAAVAQAQAQASLARATWLKAQNDRTRAEQLARGEDLISPADLDQARTQASVAQAQHEAARYGVQQAQAMLSEAREALRKTVIVAPMSGRVTRLNIDEGETAIVGTMNNPGSLLLTVADLSEMEARVQVDETDVPGISIGDSAAVQIDAFPERVFAGRVTRIGNSAIQGASALGGMGGQSQQQAVDFEVVITLADPPEALRPDLSATADIVTDARKNALAVPIIALTVRDPDGKKFKADEAEQAPGEASAADDEQRRQRNTDEVEGVFVVRDGQAVWVPISVGIAGERYFEVTRGLRGGETVVSGSYQAIRDLEAGTKVRTTQPKPDTDAAKTATKETT